MAGKPAQDRLATARRHVAEAEHHVARQEMLLERLSRDERRATAATDAREVLDTLKHSLRLAREQLAFELQR